MAKETPVKRWTARREPELANEIFKGKAALFEAVRQHDLTVGEVGRSLEDT